MTTYKYTSLLPQEIRLLILQPGQVGDPLIGCLANCRFAPKDGIIPDFEALSYTWGEQSNPELITILDTSGIGNAGLAHVTPGRALGTVAIGRNLAAALHRLRDETAARVLWCDSICINQGDLCERASQVLRMCDIYRETRRVVVWLGPEADNSALAMSTLRYTGSQVDSSEAAADTAGNFIRFVDGADPRYRGQAVPLPFSPQQWEATAALLARSWFRRLWIRQEITLANADALVLAGNETMLWTQLVGAAACIRSKETPSPLPVYNPTAFAASLTNLSSFRRMKVIRGLHGVVDYTRQCECTDDRDRVYALLGLLQPELAATITPDYTKPVKQVYREMVVEGARFAETLNMLEYCDSAVRPTWVPDLQRLRRSLGHFEHTWAAGESEGVLRCLDGERVEVQGVVCDEVEEVLGGVADDCSNTDLQRAVTTAILHFLGPKPASWPTEQLESVTRAVLGGRTFEDVEWQNYPRIHRSAAVLTRWAADQPIGRDMAVDETRVRAAMREILPGRCFYRTRDGSFITGPTRSQRGDTIAVLLGCRSPLILRPSSSSSSPSSPKAYTVLGPSFHPSLTHAQALLGPLPRGYHAVLPIGSLGPTFKRAGELWRKQDPRLDGVALPPGWEELEDEDGWPYWFEGGRRGDEDAVWRDPRLRVGELRGRGVRVEGLMLE